MVSHPQPGLPADFTWYKGKSVVVMGLGVHGGAEGNIRWLAARGANVLVTDVKSEEELTKTKAALAHTPNLTWQLGGHAAEDFEQADLVLQNPAVPRDNTFLAIARQAGAIVTMDSSLFLHHCESPHVIGITGSKGKTTTATAMAHMLHTVFQKVHLIGVEGQAPLPVLDQVQPDDAVVFELSSWRLESLGHHHLSPPFAVITSLYRDHLNTYDSWEDYLAAKKEIVNYQTSENYALLNYDDPTVRSWAPALRGNVWWYSRFEQPDGEGIGCEGETIVARLNDRETKLGTLDKQAVRGNHQQRNLLPGMLLAHHFGAAPGDIIEAATTFTAPPGRLEVVAVKSNISYINDTTATIPDATLAALKSFETTHVVLIAGGSDKELDFTELAAAVAEMTTVHHIVLLPGTATDRLEHALAAASVPCPRTAVTSMDEAVSVATEQAQAGDTILLSPGATSFGLFQHEFARGDAFRTAVDKIK